MNILYYQQGVISMLDLLDSKGIFERADAMRTSRGWTFYELAKRAAVPVSTIYNWRNRMNLPSLELLDAVCYAFGISVVDFLLGDDGIVSLTDEQKELIRLWNTLSRDKKDSILNLMKTMQN